MSKFNPFSPFSLPFRLQPVFKDYIWGGTRLKDSWGKSFQGSPLAESWELAAHPDGESIILDGPLKGMSLSEAVKEHPEIVSPDFEAGQRFPLMVKLIDAREFLSIQVHPDDEYAMKHENGPGKTEMWYILEHEPGAFLYLGFKRDVTRDELEKAILNHTLPDILRKVYVKKGDALFIRAGTVHAIGAGILLAEIQENSNLTYRVYDYGRVGADGRPRELHIQKALDVVKTEAIKEADFAPPNGKGDVITASDEFRVELLNLTKGADEDGRACVHCDEQDEQKRGFKFLLCIEGRVDCSFGVDSVGAGSMNTKLELKKGDNVFIPAGVFVGSVGLEGEGKFLAVSQGPKKI